MIRFNAMRKFFTVLSVFFFIFASAIAETTVDDVFRSLTETKVTTGNFVQVKKSKNLKRPLKSSGTYIFSDKGIAWQTLKPFKNSTVVTRDSIIQIGPDGKKNVTDGSSNETFKSVASTLSSLFAGEKASIEKFFTIKSFESNAAEWKMVLEPNDKTIAQALNRIILSGKTSASRTSLDAMEVVQGAADSTTYTLSNQKYKQELSADEEALFKK